MTVSKIRLPDNTEHDIRAKYLIQSTSSDAVSEEFVTKVTTEDAIANIQKIYGNTIKFNQLLSLSAFSPGGNGVSVVTDGETFTLTTASLQHLWMCQDVSVISGHVYIISFYAKLNRASVPSSTYTGGYFSSPTQWFDNISATDLAAITNTGAYYKVRITANGDKTRAFFGLYRRSGTDTFSSSDSLVIKYPMLIDLTQMYGAGNEPTLAQFEEEFNLPYYEYNPSGLLSVKATAIQSTDSSNNVIGNCGLNIPSLTGKLNGTGSSVIVFPNGMQSNGTTRDELTATSAIKRIADDNSVLSTPQTYVLDNALQLQYPVVAGGTEMVLPTNGTAPMKMDVIYGNAADAAATMSQNFISVDSMKDFLLALGTQMGGTWSIGYENGKHTFTFTSN